MSIERHYSGPDASPKGFRRDPAFRGVFIHAPDIRPHDPLWLQKEQARRGFGFTLPTPDHFDAETARNLETARKAWIKTHRSWPTFQTALIGVKTFLAAYNLELPLYLQENVWASSRAANTRQRIA